MIKSSQMIVLVLACLVPCALPAQAPASSDSASTQAPRTFFMFRMWPDYIVKYDVRTDRVVGRVKSKNGISHSTVLSHDKKKIFNVTGQRSTVEVLDVGSMEIEEEHSFKREGYIIRIQSVREVPGGTHWYVKVNKIKANPDHFVIEKPEWLYYDIEEQKIEKKLKDLPKAIRSGARISPDGKSWHVFGKDITVIDPKTLKETGKIELSKPLYTGMGPLSVRSQDLLDGKDPKAYRLLYTMTDPVKTNRRLFGIVDIDMDEMKIAHIRELGWNPPTFRFFLTRDKRTGIATIFGRGRRRGSERAGDRDLTLFTYDLEQGRKVRETNITVRNGLGLSGISPDGKKLYMMGRGHEIVIYDDHHNYVKTVKMDGETDGRLIVVEE